jgi:fatty acid synthase subunit alpha, fungi type
VRWWVPCIPCVEPLQDTRPISSNLNSVVTRPHRIETQDVILNHYQTERLVEVGPSSTLLNMARRTLENCNDGSDDARATKRRLLSVVKDYKEICYDEDPAEALQDDEAVSDPIPALPPVLEAVIEATGLTTDAFEVVAVPDTPVPAVDAVKVLVAYDLKKSTQEISLDDTVRGLAGGGLNVCDNVERSDTLS